MMTNERRAFGRPIILTIVTTLCIFCSAAVGQTISRKVRSGEASSILCDPDRQGTRYRWTLNDDPVTSDLTGIDSETIESNRIRINRMTQQLAGVYQCYLHDDTRLLNTVRLFIVGLAEYSTCVEAGCSGCLSCSINHTYSPTNKRFELNASIIFMNSGIDCCNENLTLSLWTVKPNPGTTEDSNEISLNNSKFLPPGVIISVQTSNDFTSNIAVVDINDTNTMFQIVHSIHPVVDGINSRQLTLTFNFNYTDGPTPTPSSSSILPSSATVTTSMLPPTVPVTPETSSSSSTIVKSSPTPAVTMTTNIQPPNSTSESSVTATPTSSSRPVSQDEDNNTGVIVGIVVGIIVLAIIGAVVATAVFWWYRYHHDKNKVDFVEQPKDRSASGNRPTTLNYSETPLLDHINTYTSTATATPVNGALGLNNPQDPANQESNQEEVQDDDLGEENDDDGGSAIV